MAHRKVKHIILKKAKGGYTSEVHYHPPVQKTSNQPTPYNPSDYDPEPHVHADLDAVHDHIDDMAPHMTIKADDDKEPARKGKSRYKRMAKDLDE